MGGAVYVHSPTVRSVADQHAYFNPQRTMPKVELTPEELAERARKAAAQGVKQAEAQIEATGKRVVDAQAVVTEMERRLTNAKQNLADWQQKQTAAA